MLVFTIILLLFSNALTVRRDKSILFSRVVITALTYCSLIALNALHLRPLEKGIGLYGGLFNITSITHTFNIFIFILSGVILILTGFFPRKVFIKELLSIYKLMTSKFLYNKDSISNKTGEQFRIIEYALIIVFVLCGGVFLMSTGDLISIFLSIELQSYGLYIICTLYRDSESATASGLTYFLLGGLSSCFILLGSALLYSNSGTTNLDNIYVITTISELFSWPSSLNQLYFFNLALIIMSVGFLFKVSAAPFHFWSPDVYDGIPTIVTTFVALIAKISIFIFLLELVYHTDFNYFGFYWKNVLLLSSMLSLFIGSILGLTQFRIKRLLAYSTISHVGFILLALSINSVESIQSFVFYLLQYSISNLNAFLILISIGFSFYLYVYKNKEQGDKDNLIDRNNSPIQLINQIKGYFYINPMISLSFAITIFSFIGIPPMIGFFAKQMILSAALDNGYLFMSLFAISASVVGAGYYLDIVNKMFFFKNNYKKNSSTENTILIGRIISKISVREKDVLNVQNLENVENVQNIRNLENEKIHKSKLSSPKTIITFNPENITINSALSISISILTLVILTFIWVPYEWFNLIYVLTLIQFKA